MRLVATAISHSFGTTRVLADIDITIEPGSRIALVGPSGSGKSTLLSILGGTLAPDHGEVAMCDDAGTSHRSIGVSWVLQGNNAFGLRSAYDNIYIATLSNEASRRDRHALVQEVLNLVGLTDRATERANRLSGGELQRLSIARALVSEAEFMLADEPTGQLDHHTSERVLDAMFVETRPKAIVVATHDPLVAARCDITLRLIDAGLVRER